MSPDKNFIIVVDDDPDVLESLSELLGEHGYPVIPCRSGEDAIGRLLNNNTSLILTDIRRSEEHTSELQSHSFISYAVFCLKKKIKNQTTNVRQEIPKIIDVVIIM